MVLYNCDLKYKGRKYCYVGSYNFKPTRMMKHIRLCGRHYQLRRDRTMYHLYQSVK